jgi:hypothetical protein
MRFLRTGAEDPHRNNPVLLEVSDLVLLQEGYNLISVHRKPCYHKMASGQYEEFFAVVAASGNSSLLMPFRI